MDGHRTEEEAWREINEGLGSHHSHQDMHVRQERPGGKGASEPWHALLFRTSVKPNTGEVWLTTERMKTASF